jgi:hypothetical protein
MRPVALCAIALLVIVGASGCGPRASATRPVHCAIIGDPPERDNSQAPKKIVAGVRFWCDDPGSQKLTLTVRLQKQNPKGTWVDVMKKTYTAKGDQTTRPEERYHTRTVSIPCTDGNFRTVVVGSNVSRNVTKAYESIGARANDPCQPSIFTQS